MLLGAFVCAYYFIVDEVSDDPVLPALLLVLLLVGAVVGLLIVVRIDVELAKRKMSVGEFAERIGLTPANVAVLKNGRAKAVRFSTLEAMCRTLDCQPGDLLEWVGD